MSDLVLAEKDPATVIAEALQRYKEHTGVTLQPADPRRLHLEAFLLLLVQQRSLIDFAGKQSLLRFVSALWIPYLAELWGIEPLPELPSRCTERFNFGTVGAHTIPAGVRVSDGTNQWRVTEDTSAVSDHVDAPVECTVLGADSNSVAIDQIDTLVDPDLVPGCTSVQNTTETDGGRAVEDVESLRTRLRDAPESTSTAGPRVAYEALALKASTSVADAVCLGPDDGGEMDGAPPADGEVFVLIIQGVRDANGVVVSVEPLPEDGLIDTVDEALSAEDVRPLTDLVTVQAPSFQAFDSIVTYYIAKSRKDTAAAIQAAVEEAYEGWLLWQQSKIGRDINPDELRARLVNAGAKRVVITDPAFQALGRDVCARCDYSQLVYAGVEND